MRFHVQLMSLVIIICTCTTRTQEQIGGISPLSVWSSAPTQ
jgi:hypothetical protein